ncbi:MAG: sorbosone dehydrogenase [Sphingomonas bacterium]|nr:sorbosone dehydrogenase [Sphingomonas bacterium]
MMAMARWKKILIAIVAILVVLAIALVIIARRSGTATLPVEAVMGPKPTIIDPKTTLFPTVNIADAKGWAGGAQPTPAAGLKVNQFAAGLDHPRWLLVLQNGDVLVAETQAPPKPKNAEGGIRDKIMQLVMGQAGSGARPSANRITLLRDGDGDGVAESRSVLIGGLNSPFGMALLDGQLYIANADALVRVPFTVGQTRIDATPVKVVDLPAGINHHWTKNVVASPDGSRLYVTVGSNSNVAERGMAVEEGRAAIWEVDPKTGNHRIFAGGLRNPNGMAWEPETKELFTVVNERDEIGSDIVPDYLTSVEFGGFYGWPWFYWGGYIDKRVQPANDDMQQYVKRPDYALGPHTASLGLTFASGQKLGPQFGNGAFIGQHGSWNRKPKSGYKVIFVPFAKGMPAGKAVDVLTGFLDKEENAQGRPVGVQIDKTGSLLVADDVGNRIWRVSAAQ